MSHSTATGSALPGWSDASLRVMRGLGAVFAGLQFAIYTPPPGVELPFSRWVGAAVAAPLLLVNVLDVLAGPRFRRHGTAWALTQLVIDSAVAMTVLWLFAFDATNALWA